MLTHTHTIETNDSCSRNAMRSNSLDLSEISFFSENHFQMNELFYGNATIVYER